MQDLEFTIQRGQLYMLQTRNGKRTGKAMVKIAVDLVAEGKLTPREAVLRVERGTRFQVEAKGGLFGGGALDGATLERLAALLHDRMTESVLAVDADAALVFRELPGQPMRSVPVSAQGRAALDDANRTLGLALSADEIDYVWDVETDTMRWEDRRVSRTVPVREHLGTTRASFHAHIHPDDRDRVARNLRESLEQGDELFWSEYRLQRRDGTWIDVMDRAVLVRDGDPRRPLVDREPLEIAGEHRMQRPVRGQRHERQPAPQQRGQVRLRQQPL